ncbi:hypothetical protein [Winogradskyella poriferorum]|uniref:hypothetical protein n=1 Tax=Winogradskyella poriferorum TaxID=307627 RepID=UPI003D65B031
MFNRFLYLILCFYSTTSISFSQNNTNNSGLYQWLDAQIDQVNSGIFNGTQYAEEHRMINEKHKFFENFSFERGTLFYDGSIYPDILMRYNVYEKQIIVKGTFKPNDPEVILDNSKLHKFILSDHTFEYYDFLLEDGKYISGFFENLLQTESISVFKKHQKQIRTRTSEKLRYHEFEDNSNYIVVLDDTIKLVKNPKRLVKLFPKYKEDIKAELSQVDKDSVDWDLVMVMVFRRISTQHTKSKI